MKGIKPDQRRPYIYRSRVTLSFALCDLRFAICATGIPRLKEPHVLLFRIKALWNYPAVVGVIHPRTTVLMNPATTDSAGEDNGAPPRTVGEAPSLDARFLCCEHISFIPTASRKCILADLLAAVRYDPRYLPILPALFTVPDTGQTPSVANMFYSLLDLEEIYPPNLRRCQSTHPIYFVPCLIVLQLSTQP